VVDVQGSICLLVEPWRGLPKSKFRFRLEEVCSLGHRPTSSRVAIYEPLDKTNGLGATYVVLPVLLKITTLFFTLVRTMQDVDRECPYLSMGKHNKLEGPWVFVSR